MVIWLRGSKSPFLVPLNIPVEDNIMDNIVYWVFYNEINHRSTVTPILFQHYVSNSTEHLLAGAQDSVKDDPVRDILRTCISIDNGFSSATTNIRKK